MDTILVAVGSTRRPKLNAVWEAVAVFGPTLDNSRQFEIESVDVPSGVGHTPLSREELMRGARSRAEALVALGREQKKAWRYYVGLEGGLDVIREGNSRRVFLESWAYVSDGSRGAFGRSGGIEVPEELAHQVVDEGVELSAAIDAFAGGRGIRDAQGAWGVLTRNFITRQDAFRVATIAAFARFYNAIAYPEK
ncbi:MAG: DUF84 family protein [Candidatus Acidiferrales bacterium]